MSRLDAQRVEAGAIATGDEGEKSEYAVIRCGIVYVDAGRDEEMQAFQDQLQFHGIYPSTYGQSMMRLNFNLNSGKFLALFNLLESKT